MQVYSPTEIASASCAYHQQQRWAQEAVSGVAALATGCAEETHVESDGDDDEQAQAGSPMPMLEGRAAPFGNCIAGAAVESSGAAVDGQAVNSPDIVHGLSRLQRSRSSLSLGGSLAAAAHDDAGSESGLSVHPITPRKKLRPSDVSAATAAEVYDNDEACVGPARQKPPGYWLSIVTTDAAFACKTFAKQLGWMSMCANRVTDSSHALSVSK